MFGKNAFIPKGALKAFVALAAFVATLTVKEVHAGACCMSGNECKYINSCEHDTCHCGPSAGLMDFGLLTKKDDWAVTPAKSPYLVKKDIKKSSPSTYAAFVAKKDAAGADEEAGAEE